MPFPTNIKNFQHFLTSILVHGVTEQLSHVWEIVLNHHRVSAVTPGKAEQIKHGLSEKLYSTGLLILNGCLQAEVGRACLQDEGALYASWFAACQELVAHGCVGRVMSRPLWFCWGVHPAKLWWGTISVRLLISNFEITKMHLFLKKVWPCSHHPAFCSKAAAVTQNTLASPHQSRWLQAAKRRHLMFHLHWGAFTPLCASAQLRALSLQGLNWLRGITLARS